jgi:hypothetical protein
MRFQSSDSSSQVGRNHQAAPRILGKSKPDLTEIRFGVTFRLLGTEVLFLGIDLIDFFGGVQ